MQKKSNEDEAKENSFNVILVPWHFFGNSILFFFDSRYGLSQSHHLPEG